jgi:ABC-type multidrug transport system fused ATPase/permease subunit
MNIKAQLWVISLLFRYPKYLFLTTIGAIVDIVLFTTPAFFLGETIRILITGEPISSMANLILLFIAVVLVQITFFGIAAYFNEVLAHRITTDITYELYVKLQSRSLTYLDQFDIGQIMARATNDTRQLNIGLSPAYRLIVQSFLQFFVILALLQLYAPDMIIIITIYVLISIGLISIYSTQLFPKQRKILEDFEHLSVISNETFTGIQELKSYTAEKHFISLFSRFSREHSNSIYKRGKLQAFYYPVLLYWSILGVFGIYGIFSVTQGTMAIEKFTGAFATLLMMRFLVEASSWFITESIAAAAASNRLYKMIFEDDKEDKTVEFGQVEFDPEQFEIEFKNVWFRYNELEERWALKNISFSVKKNETVVLIGPPGSGKSTINKLLLRLYKPTKGEILVNGRNIFDYNKSFNNHISAIEQNPFLFSDSIEFNLKFAKPDATEEELQNAIAIAQAQFVNDLPQKLTTTIGDRGVKLSGGEKQRLAIARALLLDPAILIMDDASSALDARTEMLIQESIASLLKERTSIITTHRLSVITKSDKILVIEDGSIVAQGTHEHLIQTSKSYRRLFEHQYDLPPLEDQST